MFSFENQMPAEFTREKISNFCHKKTNEQTKKIQSFIEILTTTPRQDFLKNSCQQMKGLKV